MGYLRLLVAVLLPLAAGRALAQDFILDAIHPGSTKAAELRTHFGEPVRTETAGDLTVEHFEAKEKKLEAITCWLDAEGVLQWARVRPVNKIAAADAALLFALTTEPAKAEGHAFTTAKGVTTHHYRTSGVHFVVRDGAVHEIWLTAADADPATIQKALAEPQRVIVDVPPVERPDLPPDRDKPVLPPEPPGRKPYLGFDGENVAPADAERLGLHGTKGVLVTGVRGGTPAAVAGVRANDVIVELGGAAIGSFMDLKQAVAGRRSGERVPVVLVREGNRLRLTIRVGARGPGPDVRDAIDPTGGDDNSARIDRTGPVRPTRAAWLGLRVGHMTRDAAASLGAPDGRGVLIAGSFAGGPAHAAHLAPEDVIRSLNGHGIADRAGLLEQLRAKQPGEQVTIDFVRRGQLRRTRLELGTNPDHAGRPVPPLIEHGLAWVAFLAADGLGGRVAVEKISSGSPAARAGLRVGDLILAWNGSPITNAIDVHLLIDQSQPRERIELAISRGGRDGRVAFAAEPRSLANAGRVTAPVPVREWGLIVRELNPATSRVLGVEQTTGLYIQLVVPRAGVREKDAADLVGAVILRVDGIPVSRADSFPTPHGTRQSVRLLWMKGEQAGAFMLRRP